MKYLLDTSVVSELVKPHPDRGVTAWLSQQDELMLCLSALSLGELKRGIEKLAAGKRKSFLQKWLAEHIVERFGDRVLPVSAEIGQLWGELQAQLDKKGKPIPAIDGLIAATALHHRLAVVTRNTRDMEESGVALLNPWTA